MMLDWLIVGGGIHGTHLSLYLTQRKRLSPNSIRVLDPYPEPLALWTHQVSNTGMEFLRSPHAHNLHYDPFSLVTFARTRAGEPLAQFIDRYSRPSLALFLAHSRLLIERYRLEAMRLVGRANGLIRLADGWRVETERGGIEARRVILAMGNTENPYWPDWAVDLRESGASVHHIFDPAFDRAALPPSRHVVVLGGGITAAQAAISLVEAGGGTVTLVMHHPVRIHDFDSDPAWVGMNLPAFLAERDYTVRRATITAARHRGSMPPDVVRQLEAAVNAGALSLQFAEVSHAAHMPDGQISLSLSPLNQRDIAASPLRLEAGNLQPTSSLLADRLILATGFARPRPGGAWIDRAIMDYDLPTAPDGFPIPDPALCWAEGLYVSGPLAELEVGPVSRNFIGARLAAEKIGSRL
jgi:glycine/D-amino acid oxidase-like deaminating enzyme